MQLESLPADVQLLVAAQLDPPSLRALQRASRHWARLAASEELATQWLWRRACACSPSYHPASCHAFARRRPLPSVGAAERLCTWAAQQVAQRGSVLPEARLEALHAACGCGGACGVGLMCVSEHLMQWLVEGLACMEQGRALLQWVLDSEQEQHAALHELEHAGQAPAHAAPSPAGGAQAAAAAVWSPAPAGAPGGAAGHGAAAQLPGLPPPSDHHPVEAPPRT